MTDRHRRLAVLAVGAALALSGCAAFTNTAHSSSAPVAGSSPSAAPTTTTPAPSATSSAGPGDPAVYARIAAETDCTVLQHELDQAAADVQNAADPDGPEGDRALSYERAASDRLDALACYGPVDPGTTETLPPEIRCGDVGGVFQQNYDDGRGVCVPADPRPACHLPPDQQDPNYLADLTLDPPDDPNGLISYPPTAVMLLIEGASNADCWRQPPTG